MARRRDQARRVPRRRPDRRSPDHAARGTRVPALSAGTINRDLAHADRLAAALRAAGDFEVFEPRGLSVVCFRYAPTAVRESDALDALNRATLEAVQLGGGAFLSSTVLDGRFWLRACFVNPRTTDTDVDLLPGLIRQAARAAPGAAGAP